MLLIILVMICYKDYLMFCLYTYLTNISILKYIKYIFK
jgi:hypothetical protein